jgi:ADP-heptose:LPS heptosyltransferase
MASAEGMKLWNGWGPGEWLDFLGSVRAAMRHVVFVAIGAKWDRNMADVVIPLMRTLGMDVIDLVGDLEVGGSLEVIRRCRYFAGFASGMTIVANVMSKPVLMLYPNHLEKLMYSWPCPESIANGQYVAKIWDRPKTIFMDVIPMIEEAFYY